MPLYEDSKGPAVTVTSNRSQQLRQKYPEQFDKQTRQTLNWASSNRGANTRKMWLGRHKISLYRADLYWGWYALVEIWLFRFKMFSARMSGHASLPVKRSGQYHPQFSHLISSLQQYRRSPLHQSNKGKWLFIQHSLLFNQTTACTSWR